MNFFPGVNYLTFVGRFLEYSAEWGQESHLEVDGLSIES
jgi:hypothetical protein